MDSAITWLNLKSIMITEKLYTHTKYLLYDLICIRFQKRQIIVEERSVVAGDGERELTTKPR